MPNTIDIWLRVVDYDEETILLRDGKGNEAWFTLGIEAWIRKGDELPDRGELGAFRIDALLFTERHLTGNW